MDATTSRSDLPDDLEALPPFIGQRTRQLRKLRGLTQRELADLAGLSLSLLTKVEAGRRPASPVFLASVARALRVPPARLVTLPDPEGSEEARAAHANLDAIRVELLSARVPVSEESPAGSVGDLERAVAAVGELRQDARLRELGDVLPGLLLELRAATQADAEGPGRQRLFWLLAMAYDNAYGYCVQLAEHDLAILATERQTWAAEQSDDPLLLGQAAFRSGDCLVRAGEYGGTLALLAARLADLEPRLAAPTGPELSVWGQLHLMSALAATRSGDGDRADAHYAEASEAADRLGRDDDHYLLCFGPTNVALWGVSLPLNRSDHALTLSRAERVRLPAGTRPVRVADYWRDVASAQLLHGHTGPSVASLERSRRAAPAYTRSHPMTKETVAQLVRAHRRLPEELRRYAAWAGVAG